MIFWIRLPRHYLGEAEYLHILDNQLLALMRLDQHIIWTNRLPRRYLGETESRHSG